MRITLLVLTVLFGWLPALVAGPGTISQNIKIDQFGYRPNDAKVAVIAQPNTGWGSPSSYTPGATFTVRRWADNAQVWSGAVVAKNGGAVHGQSGDRVWWFDFSGLTTPGEYYVYDPTNQVGSYKFSIGNDVYTAVLAAAVKALYYQRCGTAISATHGGTWTHGACHVGGSQDMACRLVTAQGDATTAKDLSGGWHDAGDYNKYVNFTYTTLHDLLFAYQESGGSFSDFTGIPESGNGIADLLDEVKWELDWLLKMQQANGSVLSKISVTAHQSSSPPNSDSAPRYYEMASTSATFTVASIFAHAYQVFNSVGQTTYANLLKTQAEAAWTWATQNPNVTSSNTGFQSAANEVDSYEREARKIGAAAMLYAATGTAAYRTYFEDNYETLHPVAWYYFYAFEGTYGDIALYFTSLPGVSATVAEEILNRFQISTNDGSDFFTPYQAGTDPYRAYLKTNDYVWGSNKVKATTGSMFESMIRYNLSPENHGGYRNCALGYLHFMHGVNPLSYVMLSNTGALGADKPVKEVYHGWVGDGTSYDTNPVIGLVSGGYNNTYGGTNGFFSSQPTQKKYLDWNAGWPENSWEITEPAIYYQASYIRFLARYANGGNQGGPLPLTLLSFTATPLGAEQVDVRWSTVDEVDVASFEVEHSTNGHTFQTVATIAPRASQPSTQMEYHSTHRPARKGRQYYRLKMNDLDGSFAYSGVQSVVLASDADFSLYPNPLAGETLTLEWPEDAALPHLVSILDISGKTIWQTPVQNPRMTLPLPELPTGLYMVRAGAASQLLHVIK